MQWVGALRVLGVRIAWHVKRPTNCTVKRMAVARAGYEQISMRAAGSEQATSVRRRASKATASKSSARSTYSSWGALEQRGAWSFCLRLRTLWSSVRVREMRRHGAKNYTAHGQGFGNSFFLSFFSER